MRLQLNSTVKVKPAEEIMVGFLAASVVEGDCWKEEVANACAFGDLHLGLDIQLYKNYKVGIEQEFKQKNNLKQMPSKYRSAKSVICKALASGVELLDDDGFPRGKTEVEKDIKTKKEQPQYTGTVTGRITSVDPNSYALDLVGKMANVWDHIDEPTKTAVKTALTSLW